MAWENASETSNQMIRLNPFRFLGEKKCSSICPKKSTENSIQMVSALTLTERVPEAFEIPPSDWPEKYFFWPISEEEQPGDSHVFLHEVVFLIERRSSVARSTGTFLRRASEKINK